MLWHKFATNKLIIEKTYMQNAFGPNGDTSAGYTYNNVDFGAEPPSGKKRWIGAFAISHPAANDPILDATATTIAGLSITKVREERTTDTDRTAIAFIIAEVPTGTSGTIYIKSDKNTSGCGITVYRIISSIRANLLTPYATVGDVVTGTTSTLSINVPKNGAILSGQVIANANLSTWTGLPEDADFDYKTGDYMTSASDTFTTAQTPQVITCTTASSYNRAGISISYGPRGSS